VAIWKWVQKYSDCVDRFKTDKRLVKMIFVDGTQLQIDGKNYWLWIAYEPALNICLMMHLSRERRFWYATGSSSSYDTSMARNLYSQIGLDGITMFVNG
jgi:transposase-like protein